MLLPENSHIRLIIQEATLWFEFSVRLTVCLQETVRGKQEFLGISLVINVKKIVCQLRSC